MKIRNIKTGREFYITSYQWEKRYSRDNDYRATEESQKVRYNDLPVWDRDCVRNNYALNR